MAPKTGSNDAPMERKGDGPVPGAAVPGTDVLPKYPRGMRVRATKDGYYGHKLWRVGDVLTIDGTPKPDSKDEDTGRVFLQVDGKYR